MSLKNYLVLLTLFSVGCGAGEVVDRPETFPVTGVVSLDGSPLAGATVTFRPKKKGGRGAVGMTDETGTYELMTFDTADGALPGDYMITVVKQEHTPGDPSYTDSNSDNYGKNPPPEAEAKTIDIVPSKYSDAKTSGFTASVSEGENNFPLEVTSR
ncbi:MAG: carboxypeptidase-like regulatory domain-containing protein [Fuerstiella sp.]